MSNSVAFPRNPADRLTERSSTWKKTYVRRVRVADFGAAVVAVVVVHVVGGYEMRFLGTGSDEFRRVLNAWVIFTAALGRLAYQPRGRDV